MKSQKNIVPAIFFLIILVFSQFSTPKPVSAECSGIVYVSLTGNGTTGCSWGNAFVNLQNALSVADAGDQIWVAAGTYYPDQGTGQTNNNRNSTFALINNVAIYGGFAGTETLLSQRNVSANVTILSGDIDQVAGNANNAYHVVTGVSVGASAVLDGFTISGGNADGPDNFGGGMSLTDASPTLQNLIFDNNAGGNGGGLAGFFANPTLTDVIFRNNSTSIHGGGIYTQNSNPSLVRVTFSSNTAFGYGGGMAVFLSNPTLTDVIFDNNQTTGPFNPGGGMYTSDSTPVMSRITFSNNQSLDAGGGGMYNYASDVQLTNATFYNNYAYRRGGAMANEEASPVLTNVTMSGNTAVLQLSGGMANFTDSDPVIRNSILWGDSPQEVINSDATSVPVFEDSLVQGGCPAGSTCANVLNPGTDPFTLPATLANNGGYTQTIAITSSSSARNVGNNATCAATDQRGTSFPRARTVADPCDMGAYEFGGVGTIAGNASATYGSTTVNLTATVSPNPGGGTIQFYINGNPVGAPAAVNAGTGVATLNYNPSSLGVGNYTIRADFSGFGGFPADTSNPTNNGTLTISQAVLTVTANNKSRTYGAANPTLDAAITGFVNGETILTSGVTGAPSCTTTATPTSPVSGSPYPITCVVGTLASFNYSFTFAGGGLTVTQATLTITADNRTKNYGDTVTFAGTEFTASGLLGTDTVTSVTLNSAGTVATASVAGSPYPIVPSAAVGTGLTNYTITYVNGSLTVNPIALTITADNRTKNYGDTVSFAGTEFTTSGLIGTDTVTSVTLNSPGAASTATVAGSPYPIVPSAALGTGLANYTITYVNGSLTVNGITVVPVITANDKVYDGTTSATFTCSLTGVVGTDVVNCTGGTATFADKHVGNNKTVTATGLSLSGANSANYSLSTNTDTDTANITPLAITVTAVTNTKVYDGNVSSTGTPITSITLATGDTAAWTQTFDTRHVGTNKTLTPAGSISDGNSGANYTVTFVNNATGAITQRAITVTAVTDTKAYDGNTTSSGTPTITGSLAAGDIATWTQTFNTPLVGTGKTLTPAGTVNDGNGGANYAVTFATNTTGVITARAITVTADSGQTKVYGSADPTFTYQITAGSLLGADSLSGVLSRVLGENVGPYAITQGTLTAGGNYTLTFVPANFTITARNASVTPNNASKPYGSADPIPLTTGTLTGFLPADGVTATYTRTAGEAAGAYTINATLNPAGVLTNYNITSNTATFTIIGITITPSITANDKTYNGTTAATFTCSLSGVVGTDDVTCSGGTATFADENVGVGKTVTATGLTLSGADSASYSLSTTTDTDTADITALAITVTAATDSKVYDGTTSSTGVPTITTGALAAGDTATWTQTFATKHVGTNKALTPAGSVNDGNGGANYAITFVNNTTGVITTRAITVTAVTNTKAFDGTTSSSGVPTITTGSLAVGDTAAWTQTFDTPLVGTGKTLTPAGSVNDGNGGNNYAVTFAVNNTGVITGAPLTVTINQAGGQVDPTNGATINFTVVFSASVSNFATGDVTLSGTAGATSAVVTGSGTTYNIAVSGMTADGTVTASIPADIASDGSGNNNLASTSADNTVTYDTTAPTVSINQAVGQVDPTNSLPINFTVTFSDAVAGFTASDISFSGSTAPGTLAGTITGGPAVYNVAVNGVTGSGIVIATVNTGAATDAAGNGNAAPTIIDNTVTYDSTGPVVTIGAPAPASTVLGPVDFAITITGATTVNLTNADVTLTTTGTATATTITVTNGSTSNPTVTLSGISGSGTIRISIAAGIASDATSNNSAAAGPSAPVMIDSAGPVVLFNSSTVPADGATLRGGPTQLKVAFNENVKNDGSAGAANNVANYLLVGSGPNRTLNTVSCLGGVQSDDVQYTINSASYTNNGGSGPFVATLNINGGTPLPVGTYHLFVCGTTSIEDLTNNELNNGAADTIIDFSVVQAVAAIPSTGFAMNTVTNLPIQPEGLAYTSTDIWVEIPSLGVKTSIVGVTKTSAGWDVTWLDRNAGWLDGSAYPTWKGNSVITAHVWDALNKPGPFARLKELKYGDQVKVHAFGQVYTYEVRETTSISPTNATAMLKHEEKSWLTLVTCEGFQELTKDYASRRMVRAVLVSVTAEK